MLPEQPSLDELQHFGVKGMHWGVRRGREELQKQIDEVRSSITPTPRKIGSKLVREAETTATFVGLAGLGVLLLRSPRGRAMVKVPTMAAAHYMSDANHRRQVAKVLKASYVVYKDI